MREEDFVRKVVSALEEYTGNSYNCMDIKRLALVFQDNQLPVVSIEGGLLGVSPSANIAKQRMNK